MAAILGISAFYHDSAAALLVDGEIVAAAQEERFSRVKHDAGFPKQAVDYCLAEAGITAGDLDHVGFYDKPFLKFERLLETYVAAAPLGIRSFFKSIPVWLQQKLHLPREMRKALGGDYRKRFVFTEHHESHAASAFFPSPFEEAAILTLDGVGEWATTSIGMGRGNKIELTHELHFPHSLGLLYSAFTQYCGFRVNGGEYKLMGLAPYGEPRFYDLIFEHLLDVKDDGSFRMDMSYFDYTSGLSMISRKFENLFGSPAREPESDLDRHHMDVAASIQKVTEEIMVRCARHVRAVTGMRNLCLAGGVALNCVGNGRILAEGIFDDLWIQPASNDAGGALGVAQFIWHQLLEKPRDTGRSDSQKGSLLGPCFSREDCLKTVAREGAVYEVIDGEEERARWVARQIAAGKVVGLMQGRMEFGPRALGCRSILGDPRSDSMQRVINLKIKYRESFRPFAPSVLADKAAHWFEFEEGQESPYMLLVTKVRESRRVKGNASEASGLERLQAVRSEVPAITHVDDSARVQTLDAGRHGFYHKVVSAFEELTGCPMVVNTSFNVRGEPIVCDPDDAYRCFMATEMDVLVLEDLVLLKEEQKGGGE
ncbi:carbamoyltransferase [Akkermansiaceae bacterium]|nr:carbamoyltransferase [bacterium]MDA7934667.1 carbamoyltransferase [Akkermansiaceae bacterium]MDA9830004.1 carbamoyltransferase [Akkermansiaceae bacterium]MDB4526791.1 carbamoyltransferase [bacterium]